jgi:hypothetical protein
MTETGDNTKSVEENYIQQISLTEYANRIGHENKNKGQINKLCKQFWLNNGHTHFKEAILKSDNQEGQTCTGYLSSKQNHKSESNFCNV